MVISGEIQWPSWLEISQNALICILSFDQSVVSDKAKQELEMSGGLTLNGLEFRIYNCNKSSENMFK